jgi:hypothetical protein
MLRHTHSPAVPQWHTPQPSGASQSTDDAHPGSGVQMNPPLLPATPPLPPLDPSLASSNPPEELPMPLLPEPDPPLPAPDADPPLLDPSEATSRVAAEVTSPPHPTSDTQKSSQ